MFPGMIPIAALITLSRQIAKILPQVFQFNVLEILLNLTENS